MTNACLTYKNNAIFALCYQLTLVTRNERTKLSKMMLRDIESSIASILEAQSASLESIGSEPGALHVTFSASPTSNLPRIINAIKSSSSKKLRARNESLRTGDYLSGLWSNKYRLTTKDIFDNFK